MSAENPVFLNDVIDECRRLGLEPTALELLSHSDIDTVILLTHERLRAAGQNIEQAFTAMGFSLEDRGEHGQKGDLSVDDTGAAALGRHLKGKLSPTVQALLHYLQDQDSAVRLVEQELGTEAPSALLRYLVETGLYPEAVTPHDLPNPIEVQKPYQKLKLARLADKMSARWKEAAFKKKRPRYQTALEHPLQGDPSPTQVAALLMPFIAGDCSDIAEKPSYSEAIGAAVQMFYLTGLKQTPSSYLLAEAGLFPVPESVPASERNLREKIGKDLYDRFAREEALRVSRAQSSAHTLSLQELGYLRRSSHQTGYDLSPEAALEKTVGQWVSARFTH